MNVLIFAIEENRWAPARLPKHLMAAGFRVAALCPSGNVLAQTRYLDRAYVLKDNKSSHAMERSLVDAMVDSSVDLVIPADECSVAVLHSIIKRSCASRGRISRNILNILVSSLGDIDQLDAMLLKSDTMRAARDIGVRAPRGGPVVFTSEALKLGEKLGFPLYVKQSFSWAGWGTRRCETAKDLVDAFQAAQAGRSSGIKARLRDLLSRSWFRTDTEIDLQQAIDGDPAMYCVAAVDGQVVGGFAGFPLQAAGENGPSTVVRIGDHPEMAEATAALVARFNATGMLGFDFMIERLTGHAYFIECNPRPIQTQHLGGRIGVDLCVALACGLRARARDETPARHAANNSEQIALFPQEWVRDPQSKAIESCFHDVPWDDPGLLAAIVAKANAGATANSSRPTTEKSRSAMAAPSTLIPPVVKAA